jgi:hypothetical protein
MILKKIIIGFFCLNFLYGCVQNVAILGPAITGASTGSISHASLSYGSSKVIKKITGKTTTENIKSFLDNKNTTAEEVNYDEFFVLDKSPIE